MKRLLHFISGMETKKVLLLLLSVVLVPLLLIQAFTFYRWFLVSKETEMQANLEIARTTANTFEAFVEDVMHTQLAIGSAATASPAVSLNGLRKILVRAAEDTPAIRSMSWISPTGKVLVESKADLINADLSKAEYIVQIISGRESALGNLLISSVTGNPVFAICRGIRNQKGDLLGIIGATVEPEKMDDVLAVSRAKDAGISILDGKGMHVFRWPKTVYTWEQRNWLKLYPFISDVLAGKEVAAIQKSELTGERRVVGYTPIRAFGWVAAASRAEEDVVAPILSAMIPQIILLLITVLSTVFAALALSRPMVTSIRNLRDRALALGRGQREAIEITSGPVELKDLSKAFNRMVDEVRLREGELRESEDRLSLAINSARIGIYDANLVTKELRWDDQMKAFWGLSPDNSVSNETFLACVHPEDLEQVKLALGLAKDVKGNGRYKHEYRVISRRDGIERWIGVQGQVHFEGCRAVRLIGTAIDITDAKRAEEALRQSKDELEIRVRERTAELVSLNQELTQARDALRRLASELVMAEDRERKRIAGVLHDDIGQVLASIKMRLGLIRGSLSDEDREVMRETKDLLLRSIQDTRGLMYDLGNPILFDLGVKTACESHTRNLMEKHPIQIRCEIEDDFKSLDPDVKTVLFQAFRELLNNVVKHSGAKNVHVRIDQVNGKLRVEVKDDGTGFDPEKLGMPSVEGGFGLYSIRERLTMIGGELRIDSSPGAGTAVTAIVPDKITGQQPQAGE